MVRVFGAAECVRLLVAMSLLIMTAKGQAVPECPSAPSKSTENSEDEVVFKNLGLWTCDPPSGSTFKLGITTVTCSAPDVTGTEVTCTFRVTVTDGKDPDFNKCPVAQRATIPAFDPLVPTPSVKVSWEEPAASDNSGYQQLSSTHERGAEFPLGKTYVKYTARDNAGRSAECIFDVHVVVQPPGNHTFATSVAETGFTVFWPQSENGAITDYYILTWKIGDPRPDTSKREIVELAPQEKTNTYNSHEVPNNLSPGELYNVEVGSDDSGEVISSIQQWTEPLQPTNLVEKHISPSSVELSWTPSTGNVEQYMVSVGQFLMVFVDKTNNTFTVDSLRPGSSYNATVYAVVGSGDMRLRRGTTMMFSTASLNASQFTAYNYTESTIAVAWAPLTLVTIPNGEPYMVLINPSDADESYMTVYSPENTAKFTGLEPNTEYQIRVINNMGLSVHTTQKTRPGRVGNIRPTTVTNNSVTLEWDPPTEGAVTSYVVEISPSGTEVKPAEQTDARRVFNDLQYGTEYFFTVVSVYEGMWSVPQTRMVTAGVTKAVVSPLNVVAVAVGVVLGVVVLVLVVVMIVTCIKYRRLKSNGGSPLEGGAGRSNSGMVPEPGNPYKPPHREIQDTGDVYEIAGAPPRHPAPTKASNPSPEYQNACIGPVSSSSSPPKVKAKPKFGRRE